MRDSEIMKYMKKHKEHKNKEHGKYFFMMDSVEKYVN